ncbi:MAG: hypothetical protein AAF555_10795 [Verrucomicrobiota bacterium]
MNPLLAKVDSPPAGENFEILLLNPFYLFGALVLSLAVVAWLIWLSVSRKKKKVKTMYWFPETDFRWRFSAPYSGGNSAQVDFSEQVRALADPPSESATAKPEASEPQN